jgi:hypothetical protein
MMFDYGVGTDCATFRSIAVKRARSGDMIILDKPTSEPGDVGHTLIVYSHFVEPTELQLAEVHGADVQALTQGRSSGPAHLCYVDASWGGVRWSKAWRRALNPRVTACAEGAALLA